MTARIAGFVTRAQAGLRPPTSVSRNITPSNGGVALHYGGPAQNIIEHAKCVSTWRAWQRYHMDTKGWVDIAYTGGFCNHGYAFAGRGAGVRTAANGTNDGNQTHYAVTWIGGEGEVPTTEAYEAAEWWIHELRRTAGAARSVKPHRFFKSTGCPGNHLVAHAQSLDGRDISLSPTPTPPAPEPAPTPTPTPTPKPKPTPTPPGDEMDKLPVLRRGSKGQAVRNWQGLLLAAGRRGISVDGDFGPVTERVTRQWQTAAKAPGGSDGIVGPGSWGRALGLR